jgi:hypothetical protein
MFKKSPPFYHILSQFNPTTSANPISLISPLENTAKKIKNTMGSIVDE